MVEKIKFSKDEMKQNKIVQKLKTSELKYRVLVENLPQKIFLKDSNSVYISCNNNLAKDLKIRAEDIAGKTDYDFFPKNLADKYRADDKRILKSGETEEIDEDYIQGDKKVFVHTVKTPIKDENGNNLGLLGIFWEITERKIAEQKIRKSEEKFRSIAEQSLMGIIILQDNIIRHVNQAAANMLGYTIEEIMTNRPGEFIKFIHPEDRNLIIEQAKKKQLGREDVITGYQHRCLKKNGETIWVDDHSKTITFEGKLADLITVVDITERKKAEQKLKESEERLRAFMDSATDSITLYDSEMNFIDFNEATLRILGMKKEELIGKNILDVIPNLKETGRYDKYLNVIKTGKSFITEDIFYNRLDGSLSLYLSVRAFKVGENLGVIARDITEHKKTEQELIESEHNLGERVKELGCLYGLSKLAENPENSVKEIIHGTLDLIPPAWQFPEITCAKIKFGDNEYKTRNFKETDWKLSSITQVNSKKLNIDISYLEAKPFLKEEENLIDDLGKRLKVVLEQEEAEQKLRDSEEKFRTLTKNIPGMVYRARPDWSTEIITGSEAICGYSIEEFDSKKINWFDIIYSDDKERMVKESSKMLSSPMELIQEYRIIAKDGSKPWVEDHKTSFFKEDGSFRGTDGVVFDITNRKEMEQKLEESEEWLSTMLKSIGDGVIAIDIDGMITFLNPIAESLTGWTQENAIGQHIDNVFNIFNEFTQNSVENPALKALQENTVNALSRYTILISKDKREIYIDDTGAPIKDNEGNIIGAVLIFKDITKRRIAEKKLQESEHNLEERIKELTCLYGLSKLAENPDNTQEDIIQGMLDLIPSSMQFPRLICVKIIFNNEEYKTSNFIETKWKISAQLEIKENLMNIEVYYLENRPFLIEEDYLIKDIGKRLKSIIEQKVADTELRDNEEKFRAISGSAHDAIIQTDQNDEIIFWNKAAEKNFGYSSEGILGKNITIVIPEQSRGVYRKNLLNITNTMDGIYKGGITEAEGLKKDGSEFPTELSFSTFYMKGKRNNIAIVRDITERKKAEEEIRLQSEIIENMSEGVFLIKLDDGTIVFTNPAFDELFGYNPSELIGKNVAIVNAPTDKTPEETREEIKGILKDTGEWHGEVLNVKKDGT
ncbi:MAG: PAS domain S-box protein, partial [Candidatus Lokiarchaeia archaeon]